MDHIIVGRAYSMGYAYNTGLTKHILRGEYTIAHHLSPGRMEANGEVQE